MSKTLIPFIAEKLGVKIGEEFELKGYGKKHKFSEYDLLIQSVPDEHKFVRANAVTFVNLITGIAEIIRPPFEPKDGEEYWTYAGDDDNPQGWWIYCEVWDGAAYDYIHKACGCVFRTREEAIAARPAKYKELTGKEWRDDD